MPRLLRSKTCERCGTKYTTRSKAQRFCGHRCGNIGNRPATLPSKQRVPRDYELLHRLYITEEESTVTLARRFGVKPITINRVLREVGIEPRKAHTRTHTDLCRAAQGKQRAGHMSHHERALADALNERGLYPIPQYAVDKYNIDLAFTIARLAVEVDGGQWHETDRKRAFDGPKTAYLVAHGWTELRFSTGRKNWLPRAVDAIEQKLLEIYNRVPA